MNFRIAKASDADKIANLHALSWQQNYRQSFSAKFLDEQVFEERLLVWRKRLEQPLKNQYVLLAENNENLMGFICSYFNEHADYGTYLDSLQVHAGVKGMGIGTQLMAKLAKEIVNQEFAQGFYLWVLTANPAAIGFYNRIGGSPLETVEGNDIGDAVFLKTRYVWDNMNELLKLIEFKNKGWKK